MFARTTWSGKIVTRLWSVDGEYNEEFSKTHPAFQLEDPVANSGVRRRLINASVFSASFVGETEFLSSEISHKY